MSPGTRSARRGACLATVDVLILAGGLGTRIRPVLGDTPKVLALIAGRPYLAHLVDFLRRFGARRALLALGHRAQAVIDYVSRLPACDLAISVAVEPQPLGTAGAIRFSREAVRSDPVLVMNGDTLAEVDLCGMLRRHLEARCLGTVLCVQVEQAARYGRILLDDAGFVRRFVEKSPLASGPAECGPGPAMVNAGVYLLSARLLDAIAGGTACSLERDVFAHLPRRALAAFVATTDFVDIGTPESLARAAQRPGPFIDRGIAVDDH